MSLIEHLKLGSELKRSWEVN